MHFKHQLFPAGKDAVCNVHPRSAITICRIGRISNTVLYVFFLPGVLEMNPGSLLTWSRSETTCCHTVGNINACYLPRTSRRKFKGECSPRPVTGWGIVISTCRN